MVKYQFTSQDAEKQINQVAKLYEIIEQQANIIKKLQIENDQQRLQLQKLQQQIDKTQYKQQQQSNSNLLDIKGENQNTGSSIIYLNQDEKKIFQSEIDIFNQKVQNPSELQQNNQYQIGPNDTTKLEQNNFLKNNNSLFTDCNLFNTNSQIQQLQIETEKVQEQNNIQKVDTNNNSQKQLNINSIFDYLSNNEQHKESNNNISQDTKKQQIDEKNNNQCQQQNNNNNSNIKNSNQGQVPNIFGVNKNIYSFQGVNSKMFSFLNVNPNIQKLGQEVCLHQLNEQQKDNLICNENQKQQINFQEDNEEESLLFGDPSFNCSNVQNSQSKAQDKVQQVSEDEQFDNNEGINEQENNKENSSQNQSSIEKQEEFQIIQQDEESNSI